MIHVNNLKAWAGINDTEQERNCNKPAVIGSAKRCKAPLEGYQSCMDDYAKKKCFDCEHYL